MAVSLFVSNPFKNTRLRIKNINLQNTVAGFKEEITDRLGIASDKQELIYMGGCMEEDGRSLHSYDVQSDTTIFVYEKVEKIIRKEEEEEKEKVEEEEEVSLVELELLLRKARNRLYQPSVRKLIKDKEGLRKTIGNVKILNKDQVTSALIKDQDLLMSVIDTSHPENILKNYPTLAKVLKIIISNITIDPTAPLFQDDEGANMLALDPAFLAQAELLSVNEEEQEDGESSTSQENTQNTSPPFRRHEISASDLANALSIASMDTGDVETSEVLSDDGDDVTEAALEQMQAMGITDVELSRRALAMSGGNVEIALNIIFEGTLI